MKRASRIGTLRPQQGKQVRTSVSESTTRTAGSATDTRPAQQSLVRLLKNAFTFSGAIVKLEDKEFRYIPVRGLMDSGSEAYLISKVPITRAGISEDELQAVVDSEIHGLEGALCRPSFQLELTWHMKRHANSRVNMFFVVDDTSFDILVPSSLLLNDLHSDKTKKAAYILHLRKKKATKSGSVLAKMLGANAKPKRNSNRRGDIGRSNCKGPLRRKQLMQRRGNGSGRKKIRKRCVACVMRGHKTLHRKQSRSRVTHRKAMPPRGRLGGMFILDLMSTSSSVKTGDIIVAGLV